MPRRIAVGMKPKKIHEVEKFARYVNRLTEVISEEFDDFIGDIVDFGSGQNYLGRTLASPPYNKHVIAIERRHHVLEGGRKMDVHAKLAKKEKILRNKKEWKRLQKECESTPQIPPSGGDSVTDRLSEMILDDGSGGIVSETENEGLSGRGRMTYIEHDIQNGYLDDILDPGYSCPEPVNTTATNEPEQDSHEESTISSAENRRAGRMVISLHSCGNLVHHGLRSLVLNSSVSAVAMIGCCYNLMTERLGPASYKLPSLRPFHPRLESTSNAFDPHGFPMSHRLETFSHDFGTGLRLNITARMMAVQAPYNWGPDDSEAFFRRHFYRALLQRILLDVGVVDKPVDADGVVGGDLTGITASGSPLIVGSLRKAAFESFHSYASAALSKLSLDPQYGNLVKTKTSSLTSADFSFYETKYAEHKKRLAVIWSLMAFSAGVVESIIAVDRWLFLKEQDCVEKCWVEPVFEYGWSPRNLVVVGVKKSAKKW
ncbi:hypothetical protein UCRPC4_g06098 [Phaeomoniella chlamydospora]|uniref:Methyltransferase domain-containing protein n=1 Tax=Phaeomoniella chlamydospora TaxID=158046 RepID=A0A0G2E0M4_PHACM|nr:hypothetical protein UCRPC4_g06098 [Phaeomoniella chlamydospora]